MNTEAKFLQNASFGLDDLVLQVDIVLIQQQRTDISGGGEKQFTSAM